MIEVMTDLPDRVLGLRARGEVTAEDYRTVLVPAIEEKLSKHRNVRLLYVIGDEFKGYSGGAAWEDAKVGMKHLTSFERVAVVTDVDWIEKMIRAFGFALPGEVRVFDDDDLEDARQWISEPPSRGHLSFELIEDKGVLILQPKGELEAADFERLSAEVDPYIEKAGLLNGLMVVAEHFPGWDDFAALSSHIRFIREHHSKIRRVAFVTGDRVVSSLPRIASRFVDAEVRAFPMSARDEALLLGRRELRCRPAKDGRPTRIRTSRDAGRDSPEPSCSTGVLVLEDPGALPQPDHWRRGDRDRREDSLCETYRGSGRAREARGGVAGRGRAALSDRADACPRGEPGRFDQRAFGRSRSTTRSRFPPPPSSIAGWPVVGTQLHALWLGASENLETALVKLAPHMRDLGVWLVSSVGDLGMGLAMFIVAIVIAGAILPNGERATKLADKAAYMIAGPSGPKLVELAASSVGSVTRGVLGVAAIQSLLAGLGMLVVGVPGAGLWTLLILILAVIQLPPTLVLIPVIIYVFYASSTVVAVLFAIWSVLVGLSDNVLKPLLMGRGSAVPMLVLFMGSLGGFMAGGILGLFVGAVVLSLGYTIFMGWLDEADVDDGEVATAATEVQ